MSDGIADVVLELLAAEVAAELEEVVDGGGLNAEDGVSGGLYEELGCF